MAFVKAKPTCGSHWLRPCRLVQVNIGRTNQNDTKYHMSRIMKMH